MAYTVTLTANPAAGGTVTGAGSYDSGSSVTVLAIPNEGYQWNAWYDTKTGDVASYPNQYTFTINSNISLEAKFTKVWHITLGRDPIQGGTISGAGYFNDGSTRTITATTKDGYKFLGWYENDSLYSSNLSFSLTVLADHHFVAKWRATSEITTLIDVNTGDKLYPRTKFSAVSDDNGNVLGNVAVYNGQTVVSGDVNPITVSMSIDENTVYETEIDSEHLKMAIDTSNLLVSSTGGSQSSKSWTATQDCWLWGYGNAGDLQIDGVSVGYAPSYTHIAWVFVRKGATISTTAGYNQSHALYAWGAK